MMPHNIISPRDVHVANGLRKMTVNVVEKQLRHECNGQVSRARQELVGAKLAPKDQTTLNELRRRRPQEQREDDLDDSESGSNEQKGNTD